MDALNINGTSALMYAVASSNTQIVSDLLRAGAILTIGQVFESAYKCFNLKMVIKLLDSDAISQIHKNTALEHMLIYKSFKSNEVQARCYSIIEQVLKHGANLNAVNYSVLNRAFFQANINHDILLIKLLIKYGADPFIKIEALDEELDEEFKNMIEGAKIKWTMNAFLQGLKAKELSFVCPTVQRIGDSLKTEATVPKPL